MTIEKMREEFEAWIESIWQGVWLKRNPDNAGMFAGQYLDGSVHMAWKGRQASRAAVVIELPSDTCIRLHDYTPFEVRDLCAQAIEAAGLKVKP